MQLKLDMSCHLLNVYTKFQIDISKHVEKKSGKSGRTDGRTDRRTDGQTDGRTLPRHNTSRFSNGRIKNWYPCPTLVQESIISFSEAKEVKWEKKVWCVKNLPYIYQCIYQVAVGTLGSHYLDCYTVIAGGLSVGYQAWRLCFWWGTGSTQCNQKVTL